MKKRLSQWGITQTKRLFSCGVFSTKRAFETGAEIIV
jgi:hypothetical protein